MLEFSEIDLHISTTIISKKTCSRFIE